MMDYEGFWAGFVVLFLVLPVLLGAGLCALWTWRRGKRGIGLVTPALCGGVALAGCVFVGY